MEQPGSALAFDEALDALAHVQRRTLLVALLDHNPQDASPVVVTDDEAAKDPMRRLITMDHVHLPKLEDYGFITWDREHNEVTKGPQFDEIRPLLELLNDHEGDLPDGWL